MSVEELEIQIREEKNEAAKKAYADMLDGCENEPADFLWFIPWKIILKENEKAIGNAAFKGPQNKGIVEVSFSILPSLQNQGYMTEALSALVDWAFRQRDVYGVAAETAPGNKASQRVLENNGFSMFANGQEGPRYKIIKRRFFKSPIIFAVALVLGIISGFIFKDINPTLNMGIFSGLGVLIGAFVDVTAENRRKRILG